MKSYPKNAYNYHKISDAKKKIDDSEKELKDGIKQFEEGKQKYADGIEEGKQKIADGERQYNEGLRQYNAGKSEYEVRIREAEAKLEAAQAEFDEQYKNFYINIKPEAEAKLSLLKTSIDISNNAVSTLEHQLAGLKSRALIGEVLESEIKELEQTLRNTREELAGYQAQYD